MAPAISREESLRYIRAKVDQLLTVMGTLPLRPEELDDDTLVALDPIGIVAESFRQVLDHLNETNRRLGLATHEIRAILDTLGAAVVVLDSADRVEDCNQRAIDWLFGGICRAEALSRPAREVCSCADALDGLHAIADGAHHVTRLHDRELQVVASRIVDPAGGLAKTVVLFSDVTERQREARELALVSFALNHVDEAAYLADEAGRFQYVNDEACRALGRTRAELLDLGVTDVDVATTSPEQWAANWQMLKAQKTATFESHHRRADGGEFPVEINANYFEFFGQPYVLGLVRDISERKAAEEQIRSLAYFDALTGLPNRRLLMDRLGQALSASGRRRDFCALMILDLDNFKSINDTLGHDMGDHLLVEAARRIVGQVRQEDTVSRLGGDEFVVMVEGLGETETQAATQAEAIAEKIRQALGQPYPLTAGDHPLHSTTSIGVTVFRGHSLSLDVLLKQADVALYQAKGAGRNAVRFFNPEMQAAIDNRLAMENALRRGLLAGEFRLHYQPLVDLERGLVGAEALLRWQPAGQPLVMPAQFIPLAEETGLIVPIGHWVLETACAQLAAWAGDEASRGLHVAINISARQFRQPDFPAQIREALTRTGADPALLKLELTESVVLDNVEETIVRMEQIRALGVRFSLDDFGTGYSSLSYLKRLPLDQVKIDRSFVRDLATDPNDAAIVRAIVAMSHSLGLAVIAEGVETEDQLNFLRQCGCHRYQGYLFGKPMPLADWRAQPGARTAARLG